MMFSDVNTGCIGEFSGSRGSESRTLDAILRDRADVDSGVCISGTCATSSGPERTRKAPKRGVLHGLM